VTFDNTSPCKKIGWKVILFLTMQSTQLINATVTAERSRNGMNLLSMSSGSELEPGPGWSGQQCGQKLVPPLGVPMMSREAHAMARAVGWGGFPGG